MSISTPMIGPTMAVTMLEMVHIIIHTIAIVERIITGVTGPLVCDQSKGFKNTKTHES